ncbi:MAG: hypothetical protein M3Q06_12035 [Bacteroidota bacterium]|nr:hypothetical protein [Bacteroidota bacterium]
MTSEPEKISGKAAFFSKFREKAVFSANCKCQNFTKKGLTVFSLHASMPDCLSSQTQISDPFNGGNHQNLIERTAELDTGNEKSVIPAQAFYFLWWMPDLPGSPPYLLPDN